jgi:hypothetical protein
MRLAVPFIVLVALTAGGRARDSKSELKGRLVSNGQPMTFPPTSAAVVLSPMGADDQPDVSRAFTCVVNEDGSFELVASGGELPAGTYQVSIQAMGKIAAQMKPFAGPARPSAAN